MCPVVDSGSGSLPFELEIDILSRLPAISVLRFRSVCKSWNAVTRTSAFITTHYSKSLQSEKVSGTGNLLLYSTMENSSSNTVVNLLEISYRPCRRDWSLSTLSSHDFHPRLFLAAAAELSHGFLCLTVNSDGTRTNHNYLYNPTTREMIKLPSPTKYETCTIKNRRILGFVLDPLKEEFKVVYSVILQRVSGTLVEIYTGKFVGKYSDRPWCKIGVLPFLNTTDRSVVVNGNLHWLVFRKPNLFNDMIERSMVWLDLEEQEFRSYSMEKVLEGSSSSNRLSCHITKLQDSLALMEESRFNFRFWIMNEYGNVDSWNLLYTFSCDPFKERCRRYPSMQLYCIWKDERILFCYCNCIMVYNPKNNKAEILHSHPNSNAFVLPFVGNLLSLKDTFVG